MKKLFSLSLLLILLLFCSSSFASVGIRLNGAMIGTATDLNLVCGSGTNSVVTVDGSIYNVGCSPSLSMDGTANGGYTSLATVDTGIPVTYAYVRKSISSAGTTSDTLANGIPGQLMTIAIDTVASGTWKVTPTTATDFASITFSTAGQRAVFLYLNDTNGWFLIAVYGSTLPTVTAGN